MDAPIMPAPETTTRLGLGWAAPSGNPVIAGAESNLSSVRRFMPFLVQHESNLPGYGVHHLRAACPQMRLQYAMNPEPRCWTAFLLAGLLIGCGAKPSPPQPRAGGAT